MVWRSYKIIEVSQYFIMELVLDQTYTSGSLFLQLGLKNPNISTFKLNVKIT
jgi:hypothetical protein